MASPRGEGPPYFTEMCSGSEAGSNLRLIDFVYHSNLGLRVINKDHPRGGAYPEYREPLKNKQGYLAHEKATTPLGSP